MQHPQRATTSCTSGTASRPPRPTTSTGMPRASSACRSGTNCDRLRHSTAMSDGRTFAARPSGHGCPSGAMPRPAGQQRGDLGRHPLGLVEDRVQQGAGHRAPLGPVRRGDQPRDVGRLVPQFRLDGRCRVEHPRGVAEAGGQLQHRGRARGRRGAERPDPGHHREVGGEPAQVAGARAAPAVDGLARVADRGHRVPAAEQRPQQHQLGVAGVLVLVEQHDLVAGALGRADLGVPAGDPGRQRHLVPVVEHLAGGLGRRVAADQRQKLLPGALGGDYLPNGRAIRPGSASCSAVSQRPTAVTSLVSRRCSARSPARSSTAAVTVCGVQMISSIGPS